MRTGRRWCVGALAVAVCALGATAGVHGIDWPEHRGKGNTGVWEETGILEKFPPEGLESRVRWRTPIRSGYSGPAVVNGMVYVTDFMYTKRPIGIERALALDEKTGKILWTQEWETNYTGISYDRGPRTTPTVEDDRVYIWGSAGMFLCLDAKTGEIRWKWDFPNQLRSQRERWIANYGFVAPGLIDGGKIIVKAGGDPNAKVMALDKFTGKEIWRNLASDTSPGYNPMVIVNVANTRQLIVWHDSGITSMDPETGTVYWQYDWRPTNSTPVATPILIGGKYMFFSGYYQGAIMLELDQQKPGYSVLWKEQSESETASEILHALMNTPVAIGEYIYGFDSRGELRCLRVDTGEWVWSTQQVTRERALHASAHMVRHGDRFFINNDFGELIIAKLSPEGYTEIDRTKLIAPTGPASQRRTGGKINWTHPAYANKHIITRNDEEIISINLAADRESTN